MVPTARFRLRNHTVIARFVATALVSVLLSPAFSISAPAQIRHYTGPEPVTHGRVSNPRMVLTTAGSMDRAAADAFDVTWYDLSLDLNRQRTPELRGRVTIHGRATSAIPSVRLDLAPTMQVLSVTNASGAPLPFRHEQFVLWVDDPVPAGMEVRLTVTYEGTPVSSGLGSWGSGFLESKPFFWTLSEPYGARDWWPNDDHPSDKADSVRVSVRVPDPARIGSNGVLTDVTSHGDGTTTWEWTHRYPIASYLVSLAGGTYDVFEQVYDRPAHLVAEFGSLSLPILHYAYAGGAAFDGVNHFSGWKRVVDVLPVLEEWYGPYPFPNEKYGHAQVTFGGGMEHQTMSSLGNIGLNLVTHELAHQWFGDKVGLTSWADLWLNEGFATQSEMLFMESDRVAYASEYRYLFDLYYDRALYAPGTLVLSDTTNESSMFAFSRVYGKGWMVLRMLRSLVGDDTYRAILRDHASNQWSTTRQFQETAERLSGMDLERFFHDWVTVGTGVPEIDVSWVDVSTAMTNAVSVRVRQTQEIDASNVDAFWLPAWVEVLVDGQHYRFRADITEREQTFRIEVPGSPQAVLFDPEQWTLWRPASGDTALVPQPVPPALSVYPNPSMGQVRVRTEAPGTIRLYDLLGRRVRTISSDGDVWISLDGLARGIYFVDSGSLRTTLIVQSP